MKKSKLQNNYIYTISILCILIVILCFPGSSYAVSPECYGSEDVSDSSARDEANRNSNPISTKCFGVLPCTYCDALPTDNSSGTTWDKPLIRFAFQEASTQRAEIAMGECAAVKGVRFCARTALAGEYGNDSDKPRLCLYEDPMDGMDTNPGTNDYHENAENESALDIGEAAMIGALSGAAIGGAAAFLTAPIGALIGVITAAITQTHNHVVIATVGCVDRPMSVGPPIWKNDAWNKSYLPAPVIAYSQDSTFIAPSIDLQFCTTSSAGGDIIHTMCKYNEDGELREDHTLLPIKTLKPSYETDFVDTVGSAVDADDLREFEARITSAAPSKICIYMIKNRYGKDTEIPQGCIDRPGYMPLPIIENYTSKIDGISSLKISFEEDSNTYIDLKKDECDILHKITFCAEEVGEEKNLCLQGYSTAPTVAVTNYPSGDVIEGLPNTLYNAGESIQNTSANLEKVGGTRMISTIDLNRKVWAYTPPDGRPSSINDDYYVDGLAATPQYLRTLSAEELGLCIINDVEIIDSDWTSYDTPGDHTYTPDEYCSEVEMQLWGAGASGANNTGTGNDYGGGAGSYVSASLAVEDGKTYSIYVGEGGVPGYESYYHHIGKDGENSSFKDTSKTYVLAMGGLGYGGEVAGEGSECTAPAVCYEQIAGTLGQQNSCRIIVPYDFNTNGLSEGGQSWNPDEDTWYSGWINQCDGHDDFDNHLHKEDISGDGKSLNVESNLLFSPSPGVGGCGSDHCPAYSFLAGNVGPGGHGKVRVRCISYDKENKETAKPGGKEEFVDR